MIDEGRYLCSISAYYRILAQHNEIKERRKQVCRPHYQKPDLLATSPTRFSQGSAKWTYFYLYVILDIFSRYVVGWLVAHRESAVLVKRLIQGTCEKQRIPQGQLTIHADRGSNMKSKAVAHLLADLGITNTHNRPYVSNDNPYAEAQFKTLKYCPWFPERFGSIQDTREFCRSFFTWYNTVHKHSGIGLITPEQVHYGQAQNILDRRAKVLKSAFKDHPKRFKGKTPKAAWINKPDDSQTILL